MRVLHVDVILLDVTEMPFNKLDCVMFLAPCVKRGEDGTVGRSLASDRLGWVGCEEQADLWRLLDSL